MSWEPRSYPCLVRWTDALGTHEERIDDFAPRIDDVRTGSDRVRELREAGVKRVEVFCKRGKVLLSEWSRPREMKQTARDYAQKFGRRAA